MGIYNSSFLPARCIPSCRIFTTSNRSLPVGLIVAMVLVSLICARDVSAQAPDEVTLAARNDNASNSRTDDGVAETTPAAKPAARPELYRGSRFGLAFRSSTLGLGADFGIRLARPVNLRVGYSTFNYSRTVADGDISYLGKLHLGSLQTLVDWFPGSRGFHISPGVLFYNGNRVTANSLIPTGKTLTSGTESFVSNPKNPITGSASMSLKRVAPVVLFGFGNLVPRSRRFSFTSDLGVVFQGQPNTSFQLTGSACDPTGVHCRSVNKDPSIQSDVKSGEQTMRDDLSFMKFYPVVSVEFGYHF